MRHSGSVGIPYLWWEGPVPSLDCVADNRAGWVVDDGIDYRYRVAARPLSLPHGEQFLSGSEFAFWLNMKFPPLSRFP
jgi:hypothetical protein